MDQYHTSTFCHGIACALAAILAKVWPEATEAKLAAAAILAGIGGRAPVFLLIDARELYGIIGLRLSTAEHAGKQCHGTQTEGMRHYHDDSLEREGRGVTPHMRASKDSQLALPNVPQPTY